LQGQGERRDAEKEGVTGSEKLSNEKKGVSSTAQRMAVKVHRETEKCEGLYETQRFDKTHWNSALRP
jgi:hypothetical protein